MEPDPNPGPDPGHEHFFKIYWIFFYKAKLSNYLSSFFPLTFLLKLDEPFTVQEIFIIYIFGTVHIWVFIADFG